MQDPYNSMETLPANRFVNIDRHNNDIPQMNEEEANFKRTKTISRDLPTYSSTRSTSGDGKRTGERKRENKSPLKSRCITGNRLFRWCGQCCRRRKQKKTASGRRKVSCWKRLKEKCKKRKRKVDIRSKRSATSIEEYQESVEETPRKKHREHVKDMKIVEGSKRSREKKRSRRREEDPLKPFVESEHTFHTAPADFTKSCCYLCAQNSMAIAAAISNKIEKAHISVQSSTQFFKEISMSDKGCSPGIHVRTVQSSVKVKMRDMSTTYPEEKKPKKSKYKLKLKKLNIIPKIRLPKYPKMRTVACETDKSMRHNNVPQCKARHGTHCVTEKKK